MKPFELVLPEDAVTLEGVANEFSRLLVSDQPLVVEVPLPSVGSSNSYLDLVQDFADASLVCERLGACAINRSMRWEKSGHINVIHLELHGFVLGVMARELAKMAILFGYSESEVASLQGVYDEVRNEGFDHEDCIHQASLLFPELADHYLGNLVMGAYYEWEDVESLRVELQRHPERRFGFFVMRSVSPDGSSILSSDGQIIVPSGVSLEKVLEALGYEGEQLLPAKMVMTERDASFIADHAVVGIQADVVTNALACGDDYVRRVQRDFDAHDLLSFQGRAAGATDESSACVGELSGCATLRCNGFTVLFLDAEPVAGGRRETQAELLRSLEVRLHDGGSPHPIADLPWEVLDDELFEQLCYDYLYALPLFDRHRLEKIGKSRSRDGGRDIVAWTNRAAPTFRPPVKYIFQCKHIGANASLTPKHFHSVSDVIEQYGARGYGVMCSGYIDATLHDKVDAIAMRRNVDVLKVDRFQLERFLSLRPNHLRRYFPDRLKSHG